MPLKLDDAHTVISDELRSRFCFSAEGWGVVQLILESRMFGILGEVVSFTSLSRRVSLRCCQAFELELDRHSAFRGSVPSQVSLW